MSIKYNLVDHAEAVTTEWAIHSGINSTPTEVSTQSILHVFISTVVVAILHI
jgi:hypothetical protein